MQTFILYFKKIVLKWIKALKKQAIQIQAEFYHAIMVAIGYE